MLREPLRILRCMTDCLFSFILIASCSGPFAKDSLSLCSSVWIGLFLMQWSPSEKIKKSSTDYVRSSKAHVCSTAALARRLLPLWWQRRCRLVLVGGPELMSHDRSLFLPPGRASVSQKPSCPDAAPQLDILPFRSLIVPYQNGKKVKKKKKTKIQMLSKFSFWSN